MKSLRQLYEERHNAVAIDANTSEIKKRKGLFDFGPAPSLDLNKRREAQAIYKSIICRKCLKSIIIANLSFSCPFCDKRYDNTENENIPIPQAKGLLDLLGKAFGESLGSFVKEQALYKACISCHSEIKYLSCPHCQEKIDLFAPYDYEGLKRKRYE